MTAEQKLANVEAQMHAVRRGATNCITCPYCEAQMMEGDQFCCETFCKAAMAIQERMCVTEHDDLVKRVQDKLADTPVTIH